MLIWMYNNTRKDIIQNECIQRDIGVTTIEEKNDRNSVEVIWTHTKAIASTYEKIRPRDIIRRNGKDIG